MKNLSPEAVSRIARWAIMLFLAFAVWNGSVQLFKQSSPVPPTSTTTVAEKECPSTSPLANFSLSAIPLFPNYVPVLRTEDVVKGTGTAAVCGQRATLRFDYKTKDGDVIYSNLKTKPVDVRIGEGKLLPGLEQGLIGMSEKGERTVTMVPEIGFGGVQDNKTLAGHEQFKLPSTVAQETILATARLESLVPPAPTSPLGLRTIGGTLGNGPMAQCGDTVQLNLTVWKLDGTSLFTTVGAKPLSVKLGESQVPFAVEQGAMGMMPAAQRTLLVPPPYQPALDTNATGQLFTIQGTETVLIEMERVAEVEPAPVQTQP